MRFFAYVMLAFGILAIHYGLEKWGLMGQPGSGVVADYGPAVATIVVGALAGRYILK